MPDSDPLIGTLRAIKRAFEAGTFGDQMAVERFPGTIQTHDTLSFLTLPMALNYRRDSVKLWESARNTYDDPQVRWVFNIRHAAQASELELRSALTTYGLAQQPVSHTRIWSTICQTVLHEWRDLHGLIFDAQGSYDRLSEAVQLDHRKGMPYLAGPKIFNYWCYIIQALTDYHFSEPSAIKIAVDTHIRKASVRLEVVTTEEASSRRSQDIISNAWAARLKGSDIRPMDLNNPLWAWSRAGFPEFDV